MSIVPSEVPRVTIHIEENSDSEDQYLSVNELAAIQGIRYRGLDDNSSTAVFGIKNGSKPGSYRISARDIVGIVRTGQIDIVVNPKCGTKELSKMLIRCLRQVLPYDITSAANTGALRDVILRSFVESVRRLLEGGMDEDYIAVTEVGYVPKGRIDFSWFGSGLPIPSRYSFRKFTYDIPENRCLRYVLDVILYQIDPLSDLASEVRSLRESLPVQGIDGSAYPHVLAATTLTPYEPVLRLGKLVLDGLGIEPQAGAIASPGMLFWMPRVFEDFVCSIADELSNRIGTFLDTQGKMFRRWLDSEKQLPLRPDFSFWSASKCMVVGDAKYKIMGQNARRADLYQLYSYAGRLDAPVGLLVYVGSAQERILHFDSPNSTVVVVAALALDTKPIEVLEDELTGYLSRALSIAGQPAGMTGRSI